MEDILKLVGVVLVLYAIVWFIKGDSVSKEKYEELQTNYENIQEEYEYLKSEHVRLVDSAEMVYYGITEAEELLLTGNKSDRADAIEEIGSAVKELFYGLTGEDYDKLK